MCGEKTKIKQNKRASLCSISIVKVKNRKLIATTNITLVIIVNLYFLSVPLARSQPEAPLPVILIHGYRLNESTWNTWKQLREADGVSYVSVTFNQSDDDCGSSADHSKELNNIVLNVLSKTGHDRVNIVVHSKG